MRSGYDFGYFIKLLSALSLPPTEDQFFELFRTYFPTAYDIKTMIRNVKTLKGGLQDLADDLGVCFFLLQSNVVTHENSGHPVRRSQE